MENSMTIESQASVEIQNPIRLPEVVGKVGCLLGFCYAEWCVQGGGALIIYMCHIYEFVYWLRLKP